ncbi:MAG TPA: hypothetical protein VK171_09895, partial [Fimbriimonas sp.]|nr:hypothetical protein [Fimbriimonas sp.]
MSLAAKSAVETHVIDQWISAGMPVLTSLNRHTTLALAMGKPSRKIAGDMYGNKLPKVEFSKLMKFEVGQRYYSFPISDVVNAGADYARGSGLTEVSLGSAVTTDPFEAGRFQTSWYGINYHLSDDKIHELRGQNWVTGGTFETHIGNAIMRGYLDDVAASLWATGAGKMPGDGVLGSIRAQVSDGQNSGGSHTDESAYGTWLGFNRNSGLSQYRSYYSYQAGGALTETVLLMAADQMVRKGATQIVVPMNSARFRALELSLRGTYGQNSLKSEMLSDLGIPAGQTLSIGDIHCYIDTDIPAGTWVTMLDLPSLLVGSSFQSVKLESHAVSGVRGGTFLKAPIYHQ